MTAHYEWKTWRFPVTDGHTLQVYETGAANGMPVISLHGGPGSGFNTSNSDLFDLSRVRLIGFDQRGCGQSVPTGHAGLQNNTTQKLVADIEALRQHLRLGRVVVHGGSWGSSLAVEYAKAYPASVRQLLLMSTFVARREDQEWSFEGVKIFFPDAYAELAAGLPNGTKPQDYLLDAIMSGDPAREADAAYRFDKFGCAICSLEPKPFTRDMVTPDSINRARLLLYYAANDFFISPALGVLDGIEALRDTPVAMVHGRYDMDCRPLAAAMLAASLPKATLQFALGNHVPSDPVYRAAIKAMIAERIAEIR